MITNPNEMNIEYRQDSYKKEKVFQNTIEEVSDNEKFSLKDRFRHLKDLGDQNEFTFMNIARQVSASSLYSHNVQVCRSAGNWSLGLKSSKPELGLEMRMDLQDWFAALKLCKQIAPEKEQFICRKLAS